MALAAKPVHCWETVHLSRHDTGPLALVMVGLPARGKTYLARKIQRYLSWLGYRTRGFNVGDYRRKRLGPKQPHDFFDPENPTGASLRREVAMEALDAMLEWFRDGGDVAIYDATNSTRARRQAVIERCQSAGVRAIFIESICDASVVEQNVRETKLHSPDYAGFDPEQAVADFRKRIAHYERVYETVDDADKSYVKIIDVGRQVVINRIEGFLPARLISFLMNVHNARRPIWLTRHGEAEFNVAGRIGGDSSLSPSGAAYARQLGAFIKERSSETHGVTVWTSALRRTIETGERIPFETSAWRALNEIDAGICDGMTYEEICEKYPEEYAARKNSKFRYRYPRGESYADVIQRVEPVIVELERQRQPVLAIVHQAVARVLYGYLMGLPQEDCPHIAIPLHTVVQLTPNAYGYKEQRFELGPDLGDSASASSSA